MKTNKTSAASHISPEAVRAFRKEIYDYYKKAGRVLPWRKTSDSYHILVSEIMLQQTQVDRVVDKFPSFIRAFPDFKALNRASLTDVYKVWQGLGYNRRALRLKKIARIICEKYNGRLPLHEDELLALPGIGKATATSIRAFGFNQPGILIETNIRAVFIHFFFRHRSTINDKEILPLLVLSIDRKNPRKWYSALMDYGAMLKKKYPNPSRKSAHYARQSPFKGSRREIRGAILKMLLAKFSLRKNQIIQKLAGKKAEIVNEILEEMSREGLLTLYEKRYTIA